MNKFARTLAVTAFSIISASSYAKTFKYELIDVHSNNGEIIYPGLDFGQAQRAVLTVDKDPLTPEVQVTSVEINFPATTRLLATGFKKINYDTYRAVVNDAWIYRQLYVDIRGVDFNRPQSNSPMIETFISEKSMFIQPDADPAGRHLFVAHGISLRDITPARVVDTASVVLAGKHLTLSLKNNLSFAAMDAPINGPREGFVIDALWMGKGQKTLYVPAPVPFEEFDALEAIGININERPAPEGSEYTVVIKFKDQQGYEVLTPEIPLMHILEGAYGPQM